MSTANIAGTLSTSSAIKTKVLSRRAEMIDGNADVSLTGLANTYVLRYNKSDDTYKADKRNLDGGDFLWLVQFKSKDQQTQLHQQL